MKRNKINGRKRFIRITRRLIYLILIVIGGVFITFKYTNRELSKVEKVQANSKVMASNHISTTEQESNTNIKNDSIKTNDSAVSNNISISNNGFDAGKIQGFLFKNIKIPDEKKIAFLTFDDGPSTTVTPKILRILKENNVKATFFIVGKQLEENSNAKNILLDTYNQGNAIANHTYSHNYSKLYPKGTVDEGNFMKEVDQTNNILKNVLGEKFRTRVIRFPGGHASWKGTDDLDKQLEENNYKFIDWNVLIGDAEGSQKTKEQLLERYHQTFKGQEKVVLLMHDTYGKETTTEVLEDIIRDLKNKGYEFKTLQ